ncbi:MAG: lipopolysaccharide biosynthesis protein [Rhodocyclaceae bacterium]|nr:lipopolysaccharide biosynthesis protein [Rhodocyclaceae bacterium]
MKPLFSKSKPVSVAKGAIITVGMRWTDRLIGIASTLILARLLVPADFGIVAMASLVVALIDTLIDLGVGSALIQNPNADREDFDTAWTLRLCQALAAGLLIALLGAPLAAEYFKEPRVENVLYLMSLTIALGGLENIGIVAFQKNMEFGRDFRFFFLRRLSGFAITVVMAFWLQSYWAMVIGALCGRIAGVWLSYSLHDFRPRFSFARIGQIWSFSQWILVRNLGAYGAQQTDKLLVGRFTDAGAMGAYSLADEISAMPTNEVLMPLGRVLFPAFVRVIDKPAELRRAFCLALGVQALVALPAGIGLALVAPIAVPLLLGQQWAAAIQFVQLLALMNIAVALTHSSGYLLLALGKVRLQAVISWLQFGLLATLAVFVFPSGNAVWIAGIRLAVSFIAMCLLLFLVLKALPFLTWRDLFAHSWRPVCASAAMVGVLSITQWPAYWSSAVIFVATIALGATAYALTIWLTWRVAGMPEGAESYLLGKLAFKRWPGSRHS